MITNFVYCNISNELNTVFLTRTGIRYFVNYAPLVKFVDNKLFEVFKQQLIKWYNSISSNIYDYNLKLL